MNIKMGDIVLVNYEVTRGNRSWFWPEPETITSYEDMARIISKQNNNEYKVRFLNGDYKGRESQIGEENIVSKLSWEDALERCVG